MTENTNEEEIEKVRIVREIDGQYRESEVIRVGETEVVGHSMKVEKTVVAIEVLDDGEQDG